MRVIDFLLRPFNGLFNFLLGLFLMTSLIDTIYLLFHDNEIMFAGYFALHGYVMCYFIVLLGTFLKPNLLKWYIESLYFLGFVNVLIDISCHYLFNMGFSYDMVGIIKATNSQEVLEFFNMYFSWDLLIIMTIILVVSFFYRKYIKPINLIYPLKILGLFIVFLGLLIFGVKKSTQWERIFLGKPYLFMTYKLPPDLKQFRTSPTLYSKSEKTPANLVIIIGESFSKSHSQLYGYEKNNNPNLIQKQKDSLLYVFSSITAPATHTMECFKLIMSTYDSSSSIPWYKHVTLFEILDQAGYKTIWVSNQSQKGGYDNIVAKYAELCDTMCWVGNRFQGTARTSYDEEVIPILKKVKESQSEKNVYFVHLMGNHYTFSSRYPEKFNYFKAKDYENLPPKQRYNIATYDNSVLYNDYVVNEIIELFEHEETFVIYFPDHGLDIYDSSHDYVGHGTSNEKSAIVAKSIPFVVFLSEKLKKEFVSFEGKVKGSVDKNYCTGNFIYTIMDIIGVDFESMNSASKSLFNIHE